MPLIVLVLNICTGMTSFLFAWSCRKLNIPFGSKQSFTDVYFVPKVDIEASKILFVSEEKNKPHPFCLVFLAIMMPSAWCLVLWQCRHYTLGWLWYSSQCNAAVLHGERHQENVQCFQIAPAATLVSSGGIEPAAANSSRHLPDDSNDRQRPYRQWWFWEVRLFLPLFAVVWFVANSAAMIGVNPHGAILMIAVKWATWRIHMYLTRFTPRR